MVHHREAHETRAAITAPATRVRLLIHDPAVQAAVETAIKAVYGMRDAARIEDLTAARETALATADEVVNVAAAHLTRPPIAHRATTRKELHRA